jgi:hypothetical protein
MEDLVTRGTSTLAIGKKPEISDLGKARGKDRDAELITSVWSYRYAEDQGIYEIHARHCCERLPWLTR